MDTVLLTGGTLLPMTAGDRAARVGDLWIRDGRIAAVGAAPAEAHTGNVIDCSGCIVLPGLIQAHLHLAQTLFRGAAEGMELLEWLRRRVWPLEAAHDEATLRASARLGIAECVDGGATTLFDMGTTHGHAAVLEELVSSGVRAWSGKALMDLDLDGSAPRKLRESTAAALDEAEALAAWLDAHGGGRVRYAYAPRFALSATPELHRETARRAAAHDRRIHTHAAETRGELDAVRRAFGKSCIRHLADSGLADARWTIAHGVHLDGEERSILAAAGTGIAHCPTSNLKLASGIADIPALLRAGVRVGLGSDGAPCNNRLDLFAEMSLASLLPRRDGDARAFDAWTALELATRRGAEAIGMEEEIGALEVGKRGDAIVVDPRELSSTPHGDPAVVLVHSAGPAHVRDVFCGGAALKRNHQLTGFDRREVVARAADAAARLFSRIP